MVENRTAANPYRERMGIIYELYSEMERNGLKEEATAARENFGLGWAFAGTASGLMAIVGLIGFGN